MLLKLAIFGSVFGSIGLLVWQCSPLCAKRVERYQSQKVKESTEQLDRMFVHIPAKKLFLLHSLTPLVLGGAALFITEQIFIALIAACFGLILPTIVLKQLEGQRRKKFQGQLVDALMILASSLKGGLSLLQSIEVLIEEMPAPVSQEFSLALRENKIGVPLDESLQRLNKRMRSEELNLIVTAISVARETGGNLPQIFTQLIFTIREKDKMLGKIKTLTTQGRLQGVIMCLLPIGFCILVFSMNPGFFDIMLEEEIGRTLIGYSIVSQIIGMFLIKKLSKVEV